MTFSSRSRSPRALVSQLHRYGDKVTIYRRVPDKENPFREVAPYEQFEKIGDTYAYIIYGSATDERRDYPAGERDLLQPRAIFPKEADLVSEDHMKYHGEWYQIDFPNRRDTHQIADVERVKGERTPENSEIPNETEADLRNID